MLHSALMHSACHHVCYALPSNKPVFCPSSGESDLFIGPACQTEQWDLFWSGRERVTQPCCWNEARWRVVYQCCRRPAGDNSGCGWWSLSFQLLFFWVQFVNDILASRGVSFLCYPSVGQFSARKQSKHPQNCSFVDLKMISGDGMMPPTFNSKAVKGRGLLCANTSAFVYTATNLAQLTSSYQWSWERIPLLHCTCFPLWLGEGCGQVMAWSAASVSHDSHAFWVSPF